MKGGRSWLREYAPSRYDRGSAFPPRFFAAWTAVIAEAAFVSHRHGARCPYRLLSDPHQRPSMAQSSTKYPPASAICVSHDLEVQRHKFIAHVNNSAVYFLDILDPALHAARSFKAGPAMN